MAEILNSKDLDRIRQMQKMDRYEPHENTIEDLLATIDHLNESEPQTIVSTLLNDLGWSLGQTGGGCTAYTKPTNDPSANGKPEGWYWLMTSAMDPVAPTRANEMVTVGLYDNEGQIVIDHTVRLSLILHGDLIYKDSYS
jgi:hypothetical protein